MSEIGYALGKMPEPQNGEEVKECLRHSRKVLHKAFGDLFGKTTFDFALEYIEMLESAQPKWISVEERLPVVGEVVLISAKAKPYENVMSHDALTFASYWGDEGWVVDYLDESDEIIVTHWMPLPEPPKEEA